LQQRHSDKLAEVQSRLTSERTEYDLQLHEVRSQHGKEIIACQSTISELTDKLTSTEQAKRAVELEVLALREDLRREISNNEWMTKYVELEVRVTIRLVKLFIDKIN